MSTTEDILKQLQAEINALREQNTTLQALLAKHEKYAVKCPACGGSTHAARYGYSCKQQFGLCGILGHQGPAASFAKTSSNLQEKSRENLTVSPAFPTSLPPLCRDF